MYENFTDPARRVLVLAQEEARALDHHYLGTEHILLGLVAEADNVGAEVLENLGILVAAVRAQVEEIIGHGDDATGPVGQQPFTPRAKKVLELSMREAQQLGHSYLGPEHLLLGLVREGEGVAAQVLIKLGADLSSVREQVLMLLTGQTHLGRNPGGAVPADTPRDVVEARLEGIQNSLNEIAGTLVQILRRLDDH
jgi:ATP-dependent Clp protease ATP-binding subunit ClpC